MGFLGLNVSLPLYESRRRLHDIPVPMTGDGSNKRQETRLGMEIEPAREGICQEDAVNMSLSTMRYLQVCRLCRSAAHREWLM